MPILVAATASLLVAAQRWESDHERVLRTIIHSDSHGIDTVGWAAKGATIEAPRDHFDPLDSSSWEMRYWADDTHWDGGATSPVFLSMGGEGGQGPPGGVMSQWAQEHGGLMFSIEHRYYGESIPTPDFSTPNLRWLSTQQALADAAFFVRKMQKQYNLTHEAKWISIGGSYSGELAAWVRLKYPHLIYGAVASSAPVSAIVDFDGYDPIVASALAYPLVGGSPACRSAVAEAFASLEDKFDNVRPSLQGTFSTCGSIVTDGDVYLLHDYISDDFMGLVQYNSDGPGRTNIRSRCAQMLNTTFGATPFERLVAITKERAGKKCIFDPDPSGVTHSIKFSEHLKGYANTSNPGRSFPYQMCVNGAGHDQTCRKEKGCIFSPKYAGMGPFMQQCSAAFGVDRATLDKAVAFNSVEYGDNQPGGTRIVFVNGDIDPFHFGGVTKNTTALLSRDITALMVAGGSHCADMGPLDPERDSASMATAKRSKAAIVARWLVAAHTNTSI
jgi:serine protease 16